jgi:gamma-glutamylcysteine synthetase
MHSLKSGMQTPCAAYEEIGLKQQGQYQQLNTNILQFIVIVEIKYFLNLNEYYLPIFILSIHFRQISFFKYIIQHDS